MVHVVSFPGLGLEFTLNRVAFEIFGRPVYWYGIIIACGLLLAVYLCSKWAPRFGVVPDHILDLMIFAVPAALIAIRAYYVIFNLDLYKNVDGSLNWEAIFRYSDGGPGPSSRRPSCCSSSAMCGRSASWPSPTWGSTGCSSASSSAGGATL